MSADNKQITARGSVPLISPLLPKDASPSRRLLRHLVRLVEGLHYHQALDAASAMAFHFFLSLIPLLVVLGYALGLLVRHRGVEAFIAPLLETAPEMATGLVREELERLAGSASSPIAPVGVLGFLWIASSGMHGLMNVFETALGAQRRPWWKKRVIAVAWVLGSIVVVSGTAWGVVALDGWWQAREDAADVSPHVAPSSSLRPAGSAPASTVGIVHGAPKRAHPIRRRVARFLSAPGERVIFVGAILILGVAGLAAFYRFSVEHPPGVRRRAWPGAFVAMSAFLIVSWGFGRYVSSLGSYALFYGGLAAVAVLLFWLYLSSLALLLGAELNAQLEGVRDAKRKIRAPKTAPQGEKT